MINSLHQVSFFCAQLKQCTEALDAVKGCSVQIENLERQVQETERRVLEKRQSLDHPLEGTDAEIQRDLNDFAGLMQQRTQELQTLQRSVDKLNAEIARVRGSTEQLVAKRGQAEMLQSQMTTLRQRQADTGSKLQMKYNLPALPPVNTGAGWAPSVVRTFVQNLNNEVDFSHFLKIFLAPVNFIFDKSF